MDADVGLILNSAVFNTCCCCCCFFFPTVPQKSLGHEVNELASSRLLKLEMENQALLKTVEELKGRGEAGARLLKAEKENLRLSQKVR